MAHTDREFIFSWKKSTGNASYAYHCHDGCEIYLFLTGNIRVYVEKSCFIPPVGTLILFKPQQLHHIQSIDEALYERIVIDLPVEYMNSLAADKQWLFNCFLRQDSGNLTTLDFAQQEELLSLCRKINRYNHSRMPGDHIRKNAYAEILLATINEIFHEKKEPFQNTMPDSVVHIMQYIDNHLGENVNFSLMAEKLGISLGSLREEFRRHTGLTLREYLLERKIVNAKTLLKNGASVTEACFASGFNDYANFIRSFKKKEGISPGKYSKGRQENF